MVNYIQLSYNNKNGKESEKGYIYASPGEAPLSSQGSPLLQWASLRAGCFCAYVPFHAMPTAFQLADPSSTFQGFVQAWLLKASFSYPLPMLPHPSIKSTPLLLCIPIALTYCYSLYHHEKRWAGRSTVWNQDCWEKCQLPQICRWHHPYGRKQRTTKEPLGESERGELKSWLKIQCSEN